NDVINKQPDNAFAYNSRGIAKYEAKDFTGSVEDYSRAIELNKKYPGAFYNRAISNYALGNFSNSSADYTRAIELNPHSAKSYLGRGIIKMDVLKNYNDAITDYNKALELNPYLPQAYYNRGLAKLRTEKINEACEDFGKVKQLGYAQADEMIQRFCN
ncbi:MAG: tetratricopeptide repeat protein, partial [Bacteroidota bacterium]